MGIQDRDYYRNNSGGFWGSVGDRGKVVIALLVINGIVFVLQLLTLYVEKTSRGLYENGLVTGLFSLDLASVLRGEVWRLLTYAFVHDPLAPWHIVFNMLALWCFGRDVEDLYGSKEFLTYYLFAAVLGGVVYAGGQFFLPAGYCLGASGAVIAVLVLCACHYPHRIIYLFLFIPVPVWVCVGLMLVMDVLGLLDIIHTHTAVTVHLAGAGFAFLYYKFQWRMLNLWSALWSWRKPRLRVVQEDEPVPAVATNPGVPADVDEHLEAKVDAVLEKVSRYGQDSLTDSEREILFRASEVYRKRRSPR